MRSTEPPESTKRIEKLFFVPQTPVQLLLFNRRGFELDDFFF